MNRPDFEPGPLAPVDLEPDADRWTLVFVRDLRHPPAKVWAALTRKGQLAQWSPFNADRDLDTTGAATLSMIDGDVSEDLPASVRRVEAPTLLEYTWGADTLRWELAAVGTGTRLTLRHTIDNREWVPKVAAGWHICLDVAERLLDGRPVGPIRGSQALDHGWEKLHDGYAQKLGVNSDGWPEPA
jgi:uncharacterized protein YndB with AHSA1/START domain